jgi:hypothetical protein
MPKANMSKRKRLKKAEKYQSAKSKTLYCLKTYGNNLAKLQQSDQKSPIG